MKKIALMVLSVASLAAFCAPVAPVTPRVATNISEHVSTRVALQTVSNMVTRAFVERLGFLTGIDRSEITNIANGVFSELLTKESVEALGIDAGMTPSEVTNVVRTVGGGLWDSKIEVWWTPVMTNGCLIYRATTNVNMNAEVTP